MASAIEKISKRAKQLKKHHPNSKWSVLIKEASREYRAGKLGKSHKVGSSGNTRTATKASTSRTKTITAHVKVGRVRKRHIRGIDTTIVEAAAVGRVKRHRVGNLVSMAELKSKMRGQLSDKLAALSVQHFNAKGVRAKRKVAKKIAEIKKELRKYC